MLAIIRGAGDIATAIALRLWKCGISVVMTEIEQPLTVRRTVAFSEAVRLGQMQVEGVLAIRVRDVVQAKEVLERKNAIPVLIDPDCRCIELKPDVVVDAILAKRNLGTSIGMASVVVGVGPGFTAGKDCHAVVETMRGHTLGRTYYEGSAVPNTAVPGLVGGFAGERVDHAAAAGKIDCLGGGDLLLGGGDPLANHAVVGAEHDRRLAANIRLRGSLQTGQPDDGGFQLAKTARELGHAIQPDAGLLH